MKITDWGEQVYVETVVNPEVTVTGTVPAVYIDVADYERFVFLIHHGATDGNLDAQVVQATDSAGTGSKNITGAAITQLGATDDDKQVSIEVQSDQLDIANAFGFVAITLTISGITTMAATFIGLNTRHTPVTQPTVYEEQIQVAG